jgi:stalled ribosome rescue protein Dom34
MSLYNAVVWLDEDQAFIFHFNNEESSELVIHSKRQRHRFHHGKHAIRQSAEDRISFFKAIVVAMSESRELVICGPDGAKFAFAEHLEKHQQTLSQSVIAIEKLSHADDQAILELARKYFKMPKQMVHSSYVAGV